ncbi:hypothetical protein ACPPVT_06380 [Angustibacter sp. McL0619]|uniref:hypothetical protein n=1 Tax=Angustibacter sp. McL0619 TaxID=3415676 RepID=UPI003CF43EDF
MQTSRIATPLDAIAAHVSLREPADSVLELLGEHVPLSLIIDLTAPEGPDSQNIMDVEGAPDQAWWTQA